MMLMARRVFVAGLFAAVMAGCSSTGAVSGGDGTIKLKAAPLPAMNAPKNQATVRILPYVDARKVADPQLIGEGGRFITGFNAPDGDAIRLSESVGKAVTELMARRMTDAGYQVAADGKAKFELSGTVKVLEYKIAARDQVTISIETVLKDTATGKVLWQAEVNEKKDRFAGIGGDNIADVAYFLREELGVVTKKTATGITDVLAPRYPALFHVAEGTTPIPGVTVLSGPGATAPGSSTGAAGAKGVLKVSTRPKGAKIYIGGVYYGLSPLRLELTPGILEVTAELAHRKKATEKVSVRKGETTVLQMTLKK